MPVPAASTRFPVPWDCFHARNWNFGAKLHSRSSSSQPLHLVASGRVMHLRCRWRHELQLLFRFMAVAVVCPGSKETRGGKYSARLSRPLLPEAETHLVETLPRAFSVVRTVSWNVGAVEDRPGPLQPNGSGPRRVMLAPPWGILTSGDALKSHV